MLRLETGIYQLDDRLYERYGFQRRKPFSEYKVDPMSLYFEKALNQRVNWSSARTFRIDI